MACSARDLPCVSKLRAFGRSIGADRNELLEIALRACGVLHLLCRTTCALEREEPIRFFGDRCIEGDERLFGLACFEE